MQLDLTSLSASELRSLLDSARGRGQAAQSYQILQEMARRREGDPKPPGRRRPAEPRFIELDLGDPLERRDEDDQLAMPDPPASTAEADGDADPLAGLTLASPPPGPPAKRPRGRRGPPALVVFAAGASVGVAAGVALAMWTGVGASRALSPAPPAAQAAAVQQPAGLTSAVAEIGPSPAAPVETAAADAPALEGLDVVLTPPEFPDALKEATAGAPERLSAAGPDACSSEPTPADRAICADPALQRLQRELRQAYAEALEAHADRSLLRQRQLVWRDARSGVDDPERLAGLYEQRIRKLVAATADARRQRP
ncbi:hypothetical protein [Phenylobacterium sp.]|uniref:hypothetical protein n=1 Tax=Phenylobacterium sp. TaxID=1871053 RepID=UPI002FE232EF